MIYDKEKRRLWFVDVVNRIGIDKALSEAQIAREIKKKPQQFTDFKNGNRPISPELMQAIIDRFGDAYAPVAPSLNGSREKILEDIQRALVKLALLETLPEKVQRLETDIALLKKIVLKQE